MPRAELGSPWWHRRQRAPRRVGLAAFCQSSEPWRRSSWSLPRISEAQRAPEAIAPDVGLAHGELIIGAGVDRAVGVEPARHPAAELNPRSARQERHGARA